jgi:hypothetical protein
MSQSEVASLLALIKLLILAEAFDSLTQHQAFNFKDSVSERFLELTASGSGLSPH